MAGSKTKGTKNKNAKALTMQSVPRAVRIRMNISARDRLSNLKTYLDVEYFIETHSNLKRGVTQKTRTRYDTSSIQY